MVGVFDSLAPRAVTDHRIRIASRNQSYTARSRGRQVLPATRIQGLLENDPVLDKDQPQAIKTVVGVFDRLVPRDHSKSHKERVKNCQLDRNNLINVECSPADPVTTHSKHLFKFGLINARSAKQCDKTADKPSELHDLIVDHKLDILIITETWFRPGGLDQCSINALTPTGYNLQHVPRQHKRGGGLAIVYHSGLRVGSVEVRHCDSFECFTTTIKHLSTSLCLTALYRPPQSSHPKFMSELSDLLEEQSSGNLNSIIMGDFNFPMNTPDHPAVQNLLTILDSANYQQLVSQSTHVSGNILDLVIYPSTASVSVNICGADWSVSSDHCAVLGDVRLPKPVRPRKEISVRKWRSINIDSFNNDISTFDMSLLNPNDPVSTYNDLLHSLLEKHAPLKTIVVTDRPSTPWYTQEVRHAKTLCRKYERQWRNTRLTVHRELYNSQKWLLRTLRDNAKAEYIERKLKESTSSRDTFAVLNTLLHKSTEHPLPAHNNLSDLTESFASYFGDKVATVRQAFDPVQDFSLINKRANLITLDAFRPVSVSELNKLVSLSASKSCSMDPIPTWLLKKCPTLMPFLCDIVNDSLASGHVPSTLKSAHVIPALKKPSLNPNDFKNYRPISNLACISKIIERSVSSQLKEHCALNKIDMYYQSAYKVNHSTETALMRVQNDLLKAVDSQGGAVLVLLDLSAAFDTIDHQVLLRTLQEHIGITGTALSWFRSYLSDRHQSVKIGKTVSKSRPLPYGVPQGSVLGPQLFSIYTLPLHSVIEESNMSYHLYADDTQIYFAFNPKCAISTENMKQTIDSCTAHIGQWMTKNCLKLNSDKTEVLILTKPSVSQIVPSLTICGLTVHGSDCVRDLGVYYDHLLKLDTHIRAVCKKAFYQIHLIHRIRKFINEDAARTLVQTNVISLIDYCNGLLIELPASLLGLLQRVQNSAARVVKRLPMSCHITPVLKELHWLPVKFRVDYKVLLLTFKSLNGLAPDYLSDLLTPYRPNRTLRSASENLLTVPSCKTKSFGGRAFEVSAPALWNSLPSEMRKITSVDFFKRRLKTFLFSLAFIE